MAINPIDIIRTQEAAQIKHVENQRFQHAQDQVGKNFQDMIIHDKYKPTQSEKSENNKYGYDAKEKGNNEYKGSDKRKNNNGNEDKKDDKNKQKKSGIDILI